ncbi:unnamed protein product [Rangifer tarandus platyrhynchus]|uniref:Uncharacterized protein n=1 Tax=Rangifer tarandus platyrhynchus TaxID=3082113 RepID=A0AC59YBT5_RANTA
MVKNPPSKAGDYTGNYTANSIFIRKCKAGSTPGLERSPEEEMVTHSSYSCPRNPMDSGAWQAHGVVKEWEKMERLNNNILSISFIPLKFAFSPVIFPVTATYS